MDTRPEIKHVHTDVLDIAYEESARGSNSGPPVILLHGFPYDVRAFDAVTAQLVESGSRVLVPYLRGYGPTRFLSPQTPRSGQQGVLALDLLGFMDSLSIHSGVLAGYDWGGRAACIVAALWPERVHGLVSGAGYNVQDIARAAQPQSAEIEHRLWYQYYFHGERGRAGLASRRRDLCKLLWRLWSPSWAFSDETFERTAASFDNEDFVEVVIHSYRHRYGLVAGDPRADEVERLLAAQPPIGVPTITFDGADDGVAAPGGSGHHARFFTGGYERRVLAGIGHNPPQEAPDEFTDAIRALF
jgi:pimeloyl-ACP methyl ester carboxylesterase